MTEDKNLPQPPEYRDEKGNMLPIEYKELRFQAGTLDIEKRTVWAVVSDNKVDSDGDIMYQKGSDIDDFIDDGGPLLPFHKGWDWAIGTAIDSRVTDEKTEVLFEFLTKEENPEAEIAMHQVKRRVTKAFSIGFIALEKEVIDGIRHIYKWALKEISLVRYGANQRALAKAQKQLTTEHKINTIDSMSDNKKDSNEITTEQKNVWLQEQLMKAHDEIAEKNKKIEEMQKELDSKEVKVTPELLKQVKDQVLENLKEDK